jgi:hypothetical protein
MADATNTANPTFDEIGVGQFFKLVKPVFKAQGNWVYRKADEFSAVLVRPDSGHRGLFRPQSKVTICEDVTNAE